MIEIDNKKLNFLIKLSPYVILAIILLWPVFFKTVLGAELVTLNTPSPNCLGSKVQINLTWTSTISGTPTYFVLRKIQGGPSFTEIGSTQNTFYLDADSALVSDKTYIYQIQAQRGSDFFNSNEATAVPAYCQAVLSPPAPSCQANGPHIGLTWSSVSGNLSTYEIWRDGAKIASTLNTNYDDGPNIEGTKTYQYFIKTIWQDTTNKDSETASLDALACPPILTAIAGCSDDIAPGGPKTELSWNNLLGVQNYQIYRQAQSETNFSLLVTLPSSQTSYTDYLVNSLPNSYYQSGDVSYYVKAVWLTDQKDSDTQTKAISRCKPFLTVESNCDEFSMRLSWTATKDATHYNMYRDGVYFEPQKIGITNTSHTDYLSLCDGKRICSYTYKVEAAVLGQPNMPSNEVPKTIDCETPIPPWPPPNLDPASAYCVSGDSRISLSWTASNNVSYYTLYRENLTLGGVTPITLIETSYEDSGVESPYQYNYYVTAFGPNGTFTNSENSQTITAVNCSTPSVSTLSLSPACETGKPVINLSWSQTTNTEAYEVWRGLSAGSLSLLITFDKTAPEFNSRAWKDTGVSPSTAYYYKIVSKGPPGVPASESAVQNRTTSSCLPTTPSVTVTPSCSGSNSIVNLSWTTDAANTTRYEIFRQDYLGGTTPIMIIYNVATKNWTDTTVLPQTSYTYKVEAVGYTDSQRSTQGWKPPVTANNCTAPGAFTLNEPTLSCQGSYPRADLSWTSSSNATSYDVLRNAATIANTTATSYADWGLGNALSFNVASYVGAYVNLGNPAIPLTGNLTIEFWANPSNITYARQNPICKAYYAEFCLTMETSGSLSYYHGNGSSYMSFSVPSVFTDNKWVHVVITRDNATRTMKSYKNGTFVNSTTWSSSYDPKSSTASLYIGAGYVYAFRGILDEVRIYNRVFSDTEAQQHYQGNYSNESNLISLWHFDESSGNASDSSNYVNSGTVVGATRVSNGLQWQSTYNWQIKANGLGGSTLSNTTNNYTLALCQPTKPGLVLSSFCSGGLVNITLRWSFATNAVKYEIYRQDKGLIKTVNSGDPEFTSRTWTDTNDGLGLNQNSSYTYWIKAIGSTDLSSQSDNINITTPDCNAPSQPQNLTATFACSSGFPRANLSWSVSTNATSYTIFRSPGGSPFPVSITLTSYTDTNVTTNANYSYYVMAYGPGGASPPSETVSLTTNYCVPATPTITSLTTACESGAPANTLTWSEATTSSTFLYKIYRNTTKSPPPDPPLISIASTSPEFKSRTWKDTAISNSTPYYYWIKSSGPAGESGYSSVESISTYNCGVVPDTPTLSLDSLFCQNNLPYATLSWNSVANAYSYNLYRTNPDLSPSTYSTQRSPFNEKGTSALSFDGVNDYTRATSPLTLTDFSVELWMKPGAKSSGWRTMIGGTSGWEFNLNSGNFYINAYSQGQLTSTFQLTVGQWYHVVLTRNSAGTNLYINGVLNRSNTNTNSISNTTFQLGRWVTSQYYQGLLDDVRIYDRALGGSEVTEHYNNIYKNEAGLKVAWHLDDISGTTASDQSGNSNNLTLYNGPAWQTDSPSVIKVLPLEGLKNYRYTVKAFGADTESSPSNEISFTTPSCLPAKPDLTVTKKCESGNPQLLLDWADDAQTQSWDVYKRRVGVGGFSFLTKIYPPQSSYPDINVESNIQYEYYVNAVGAGTTTPSDAVSEFAPLCYEAPSTPTITATPACFGYSSRIIIDWDEDPEGKTISYNVWRKNITAGEADFSKIYSGLAATQTQYVDIVDIGSNYQYKVEAVGAGESNSTFSDPSPQAIALDCFSLPPNPPNLSLNFVVSTGDLIAVSLNWTDAGSEESYKVFRREPGGSWSEIGELPANEDPIQTINYVDYTAFDNKTYEYQIYAYNKNGEAFSNVISVPVPIAKPGNFTLSWTAQDNDIKLTWTAAKTTTAGGPVTYKVLRDNFTDFSTTVICDGISSPLECLDTDPTILELYYKAVATNNGGSTDSNIVRINVPKAFWKEIFPW